MLETDAEEADDWATLLLGGGDTNKSFQDWRGTLEPGPNRSHTNHQSGYLGCETYKYNVLEVRVGRGPALRSNTH